MKENPNKQSDEILPQKRSNPTKSPSTNASTEKDDGEDSEDLTSKIEIVNGLQKMPKKSLAAFRGLNFCVTGVFNMVNRPQIEKLIKRHGGTIVFSVNKKCNFLVSGHRLEDGRKAEEGAKYKKAKEIDCPIMDELIFE